MDIVGGVLNSLAGGNLIKGNVSNGGTIQFGGAVLHTLGITGDYSQSSSGTLIFRLANGQVNDVLTVTGSVTLAGTLRLTTEETLAAGQTWDVMTVGGVFIGDFTTKVFPQDGNPNWMAFVNIPFYTATN
jgi:hypothetical protein